jgi:hypothetical protein
MPVSLIDGESLLAIDIGATTTRAVLFDVVDGEYRFVSYGASPSTADMPIRDVSEGARQAIEALQTVTGRTFLDQNRALIAPAQGGVGVDALVTTVSAGPTLKSVVVGLLADVSLESARKLSETIYSTIVDTIGLNDRRKPDQIIDSILRLRPDIIIITGGTDGGASLSVQKMLDPVGLACYLLPAEKRPAVLYAGNHKMEEEVRSQFGGIASSVHVSSNVRPSLDTEDLEPAARDLGRIYLDVRKKQLRGLDLLETWSTGHVLPTGYAMGRMMRFLSRLYSTSKGILSVDIGASASVITAGIKGKSTLSIYPQYGLGENLPVLLQYTTLENILRWSPLDISAGVLRDYIYQKAIYPSAIPATLEDQAISQAIAREALSLAIKEARADFPKSASTLQPGLLPLFDPILAAGGALSDSGNPGNGLMLLLDAIQPVGVTTVIIDQNNLLPLLGAAASRNSLLPVQVLESGAFLSVGTVIAPVVLTKYGTPILKATLTYENGSQQRVEVKMGSIEVLPLGNGEIGELTLQPMARSNVGFGPGRGGKLQVSGGALGVVIDGRGRPLQLPDDDVRRRELLKKWQFTLGGG